MPSKKDTKSSALRRRNLRVGVFVETQNLYHSAKNLYKSKVSFKEVLKFVVGSRELVRAFAYVIKTQSGEESSFIEALEKAGFEIKSKDLQIFPGGLKKGDWDVAIAVDAITLSKQVDVVVIVSGDGDYEPLVEYLQFNGIIVEVAGFNRSTSSRLIEAANNFLDLEEVKEKVLLK